MALTCRQATRISLAALGGHAADAQRLELEAHLGGCLGCSQRHGTALAIVRRLKDAETETLSPGARDAVRRALTEAPARPVPAARHEVLRAWWPPLAGGAAVAAAAALVVVTVVGWRAREATLQVVAGDVTIERPSTSGTPATRLEPAAADAVVLRANRGGRAKLADATVDLGDSTELWWSLKEQRGHLRRGRLTVEVEHRPGQHLEVGTSLFSVQVVGTRFTVNPAGVHTERGVVRIVLPNGQMVARLEAGQSWALVAEPVAAALSPVGVGGGMGGASGPRGTAQPRPVGGAPAVAARASRVGSDLRVGADVAGAPGRASTDGLKGARRALGRGDAGGARRIVVPLFRQGREVAVEARAIYAESFLVEGRYADAIDGFRLVVRDFSGTPQAESAQFAIAQLQSEHGRASEARSALQSYLSRYPRGRFVREAADRLGQLSARER